MLKYEYIIQSRIPVRYMLIYTVHNHAFFRFGHLGIHFFQKKVVRISKTIVDSSFVIIELRLFHFNDNDVYSLI